MKYPVISIIFLSITLLTGCHEKSLSETPPVAVEGVLDLRDWDLKGNDPVDLSGEWEFYWKQFLHDEDFSFDQNMGIPNYFALPGVWNGYEYNGEKLSGHGYGTYRLRLLINDSFDEMQFEVLYIQTAAEIYLNGELVSSAGVPGINIEQGEPGYKQHIITYESDADYIDIIIHVSNYDYRYGGIWETLTIGSEKDMTRQLQLNRDSDLFFLGAILIMGIYYLALSFIHKQGKEALFFSIYCFVIALRECATGDILLLSVFPHFPWKLLVIIEYITYFSAIPLFLLFIYFLFRDSLLKIIIKVVTAISLLFSIITLIFSVSISSRVIPVFQFIPILAGLYVIFILIRSFLKGDKTALIILLGFVAMFITIINDILFSSGIIHTFYTISYGLLLFIIFQSIVLTMRFANSFMEAENQQKEREQLQTILDTSPVGVIISINGVAQMANPRIRELAGIEVGTDIVNSCVHKRDLAHIMETIRKKGIIRDYEAQLYGFNGDIRDFLLTFYNIDYQKQKGVLGWATDITEQKAIQNELTHSKEIAEAATRSKSDFLANMSHEIRTPMNAIIGLSHLIQKTELSKKQEDYIHKIYGSAHNLLGIINDILDFSKIEAGKLSMESIEFNIHEVFGNLGNMITEKAHDKGLELVFHVGTEIPSRLMGDPLRLGQILLNLTNNAIKFTENGEISVRAEMEERENDRIKMLFQVRDTGIGLTEEQQSNLFQAFSQADMSTTRKYGGTGLGLSISKKLVEMMHGEIGVDSISGEGTTFFFSAEFPVKGDTKREVIPDEISDLSVLVVDDNYTSQEVLVEYLKDFSFKTAAVDNGEEAIQLIRKMRDDQEGTFDLVLLDYSMPGLNGFQTAAKINEVLNPEDIPKYILVTGYGRDEILQGVEKAEFEGFILKPVNQSLLFNTIMQAFGHDRQENKKVSKDSFPVGFDQVRGAKILLAEDNLINQQVATEVLAGEGFFVHIANNGQEAVDLVETEYFDIILMDLQMPVLDGYKATEKIRSLGKYDQLPIVAMTADAMTGVRDNVIKVGMNDYITKPIETEKLWQSLVQWIKPEIRDLPEGFVPAGSEQPVLELPEIEGIDVASGLKRVGNNGVLYRNLLKQLIDEYSSVTSILTQFIVEEKREDAIRLAHTIKGVSANLGAGKLRNVSADIESKLKNSGFKEEDLEKIGSTMDEVVSAINASGILDEKKKGSEDTPKKEIEEEKLINMLKEVIDHLSKRKPKPALAILDELEDCAFAPDIKDSIDKCRGFLGKYKMKEAVAILENMELE